MYNWWLEAQWIDYFFLAVNHLISRNKTILIKILNEIMTFFNGYMHNEASH